MKFVNLTPHNVRVVDDQGNLVAEFSPSGALARVASKSETVAVEEGIVLSATVFGEVSGVPAPENDTMYIVSLLVRSALPARTDLVSPDGLVRDAAGQPVGCKGFSVNR